MSDADWIEEAFKHWGSVTNPYNETFKAVQKCREFVEKAYTAHLEKLDTSGLAERIAEGVFTPDTFKIEQVDWLRTRSLPAIATELAPVLERITALEKALREWRADLESDATACFRIDALLKDQPGQ